MKREQKERPRLDRDFDPSADRGSELYQIETTPIGHDDFLRTVIDRQPGEHIVILGEPGAGKTTLLTRVWQSLLDNANPEAPVIVAWIPLAALGSQSLQNYVEESWLTQICEHQKAALSSFTSLRQAGRVCLLLDGADEIGGDGLQKIAEYLRMPWAQSLKVVVTCRLNLWDGSGQNELKQNFQIFRTLDFKYANSAGEDEVASFIDKWFDDVNEGKRLRSALDEVGKERIKDLAQNPLRLTLLCNIWQREQGLPDTQAGLYERFVHYVYAWSKVPDIKEMQLELDRIMGVLAKYGINKPSLRFRFTQKELHEQVSDLDQRKLLKALGWLNCVGVDESGQEVFAFFHPTFQEYFAACSIDDWDYFLPRAHVDRPVPCLGEDEPTYRVFESEWRQVILLWFGCKNVADKVKEKFIDKLTNFREQEGKFYYYRAYFMAIICISEFKFSRRAEAIVKQVVEWAFGILQAEEDICGFPNPIEWMAEAELLHTDINKVVDNIARLINSLHPNNDAALKAAKILGLVGGSNSRAVKALTELIQCSDELFYFVRIEASKSLAKVAAGNEQVIHDLINLLSIQQSEEIQIQIASCIGYLDPNNQFAVDFFAKAIIDAESEYDKLQAAWSILRFNKQNKIAINTLTDLTKSLNDTVSMDAAKLLDQGPVITSGIDEYEYSQDEINLAHEVIKNSHSVFDLLCDNVSRTSRPVFDRAVLEIQRHLALDYARTIHELCKKLHASQDMATLEPIIEILGKFAVGDEQVVKELIVFLENGNYDVSLVIIPSTFYRIINSSNQKQLCCLIIKELSEYIRNSHFDQGADFNQIYNVIWICVRSMRYQDFYQALQSEK